MSPPTSRLVIPVLTNVIGVEFQHPGDNRGEGLGMLRDRFLCQWMERDEELGSPVLRAGCGDHAVRPLNPLTYRVVTLKLTLLGKRRTITTLGVKSSSTKPPPTSRIAP